MSHLNSQLQSISTDLRNVAIAALVLGAIGVFLGIRTHRRGLARISAEAMGVGASCLIMVIALSNLGYIANHII